jgi:hypothetical protein
LIILKNTEPLHSVLQSQYVMEPVNSINYRASSPEPAEGAGRGGWQQTQMSHPDFGKKNYNYG